MKTVFQIYEIIRAFDQSIEVDRYTNCIAIRKVGCDYETYEAAEEEISELLSEVGREPEYCIKKVYIK